MAISQDDQGCSLMLWVSLKLQLPEGGMGWITQNFPVLFIFSEASGTGHYQTAYWARWPVWPLLYTEDLP